MKSKAPCAQNMSLVIPGQVLGNIEGATCGEGCTEVDGEIIATLVGEMNNQDGVISVSPSSVSIVRPEVGDKVIATMFKLHEKSGEGRVLAIEGKPDRSILPEDLYAQLHVTRIANKFLHQCSDALKRRDIIRAKVSEVSPVLRIDMREDADCGVLYALCPQCGMDLVAEQNGDWNVSCEDCDYQGFRALADDFNSGEGHSALNGAGKRWGKEAERIFALGPAGRANFIAADHREDGRAREYFRFEGEDGGKGRRPSHEPGCRLFVGGLAYQVDTDALRKLMEEHGRVTDCVVMVDKETQKSRGFGFVTFAEKSMAEAAISKLDGNRVEGRRISVRDADDNSKKKGGRDRGPKGHKLYVGNLPFGAEQSQLEGLFKEHTKTLSVEIITGRDGKPKGFGFVTIPTDANPQSIVDKLKGSELEGRRLKIELSGGNKRAEGGKPAKSARELRAMREEEEDARKKKRRPRKE